jgi:hypothetical protein
MITAKFQDLILTKIESKRKNGRTKFSHSYIEVEDILIPIKLSNMQLSEPAYARKMHLENEIYRFISLYYENGEEIMGYWQHGRYGDKMHIEPIIFAKKVNALQTIASYASGQIKDQMKYLQGIVIR